MTNRVICSRITAFIDEVSPDLAVQVEQAKKLKLDGVEIRSVGPSNVIALTDQELRDTRAAFEGAGVAIAGVGSPVNKVHVAPGGKEQELEKLKRAIHAAHALGADRIRIFSPTIDDQDREEDWPQILDWMAPQAELGAAEGITLLHENDGRFYGAFPGGCRRILEAFSGPRFKAIYDFSNAVLIGLRPMDDWFPWLLPYLESLHIKDSIQATGQIVAAGEGEGDFRATFAWLASQGWKGTHTLEPHAKSAGVAGGFSGEEAFAYSLQKLRDLLDEEVSA